MSSLFDPPSPKRRPLLGLLAPEPEARPRTLLGGLLAPDERRGLTLRQKALADILAQRQAARGVASAVESPFRRATLLTGLPTSAPKPATTLLGGALQGERKVRRVFFSFHYQHDIWRVQQIRNHWVAKPDRESAGYFDGSLSEKAKTEGTVAVKRLINGRLAGASVTCVLIGSSTWSRHWIHYEIFTSLSQGMGLLGMRIHNLRGQSGATGLPGPNPFYQLALVPNGQAPGKLTPSIWNGREWVRYWDADLIPASAHPLLCRDRAVRLSDLCSVYDWCSQNGNANFAHWVQGAATAAGRK